MKIAMLTDTYDSIGGTERAIKNSVYMLSKAGHRVKVISSDSRYRIKTPFTKLLKFSPDVVHVHTPGPLGNMGILYGKSKGVPVVGSFHSLPEVRVYFEKELQNKAFGSFIWRLVKYFYQGCDTILVPSVEVKKILEERGFRHLRLLSYGIDLDIFKPVKSDFRRELGYDSEILVLYAGWFRRDKRVDVLVDAMGSLPHTFKMLLVGEGPKKKMLLRKIRKESDRIKILPPVANKELVKFYNSADIYANASVSETMGFSMMEAMACGLPVVAAASPGAMELIEDGTTGYLAELASPESIADKINILEDGKERERISRPARKNIEKYSIEHMVKKLVEIYTELVE